MKYDRFLVVSVHYIHGAKNRLPLPPIQKAVIAVKREKQPTGLAKSDKTNMYFFDARILLSTILSTTKSNVLHTGMADIVDSPSEYWQSHSWGIEDPNLLSRLCGVSGTKHQYFPSDFIQ